MSKNLKRNFPKKVNFSVDTFECVCCGGIFPNSEKKYLGRDDICEKCFCTIRRIEQW